MKMWTAKYEDKKIVLLGFGREGRSTFEFLKNNVRQCRLQIMDQNVSYVNEQLASILEAEEVEMIKVYPEDAYLKFDSDVDLVFKSPGIPLKQIENSIAAEKITSQSNEFIEQYREQIVGITGTKGKSTTSTFITALLEAVGDRVMLVGNIGKPAFDYIDLKADEEGQAVTYVYELSSHQLETANVSPKIAVILNIFEEHLDHYHSYNHYAEAKMNIGRFQKPEDSLIYSQLSNEIAKRFIGFEGNRYPITDDYRLSTSLEIEKQMGNGIYVWENRVSVKYGTSLLELPDTVERQLKGRHNLINMAVGLLIFRILGHSDYNVFNQVFKSFEGLKHRLSRVCEVNGITYYNDSISTIPQATIAAVRAIPETETVIIGGMDRGIDYSALVEFLGRHQTLKCVLLPDTGHRLYHEIDNKQRLYRTEGLEEAVLKASEITSKGKACLLSPAAPSYGFFKNFEDRGNQYEALIEGLKS